MVEDAKIVVGIDFGTTFSGFAYASKDEPKKIFTFYDWPRPIELGKYLKSSSPTKQSVPPAASGCFFTQFKLYLAPKGDKSCYGPLGCKLEELPEGLSVEKMISDYLRCFSIFVMAEVKNRFGPAIQKKDIKWCLSVPTIWTKAAMATMQVCSQRAGLVHGPQCQDEDASLHKLEIVLEPEAASIYCQQKLDTQLGKGSKFLVVDAGGGTVDLVVHQKLDDSGLRVKEITRADGALCGGIYIDKAFKEYLASKIGCFEDFSKRFPTVVVTLIEKEWQNFKHSFDGCNEDFFDLELPAKLTDAWVAHEKANRRWNATAQYTSLVITRKEMAGIFDGQIDKVLELINDQLMQEPDMAAIMVVGGFSNSRYLMKRIRDKFSHSVKHIRSPVDPGSAICQGVVLFGILGDEIMKSRISRKTYGIQMFRPFRKGDPAGSRTTNSSGDTLCRDSFCVFKRIGDEVLINDCVRHNFEPFDKNEKSIKFTMFSTTDREPKFVTDSGVEMVGSWSLDLPPEAQKMKAMPSVEVGMYFGGSNIEVTANPNNFDGGKASMLPIQFEMDLVPV
ncbi:unnamed protein product [Calypogeia fissa]